MCTRCGWDEEEEEEEEEEGREEVGGEEEERPLTPCCCCCCCLGKSFWASSLRTRKLARSSTGKDEVGN